MKTREEVKKLLESLSLEEKVAQMMQLTGNYFEGSNVVTGPKLHMDLSDEMIRGTGSILNVTGGDTLYEVQKKYLENSANKIPMLFMADVINGFRTVFPVPLAQGCSFNPELVKECASVSARESAAAGLHVTFSPMADLCRDARWGRVMESTGEDVWLNRQMTRAMVEGYQGRDLEAEGTVAACVKHFAAYGAPEAGREYNSVDMSEKRLREEYLPAYKEAVDAGAGLVMTSFNTVNGIPATASRWLNRRILREEWNFDGVLISDYSAIYELLMHGVAETVEEAAELGIRAGVDMDMVSPAYGENLVNLVRQGRVEETLVDECALRILELKNRLGLLDNPYRFDEETRRRQQECMGCPDHRAAARKLAGESMVLLKNDGVLPLKAGKSDSKIALIGPFADSRLLCGSWSMFYEMEDVVTVKEGLADRFGAEQIVTAPGCCILDRDQEFLPFKGTKLSGAKEREDLGNRSDEELLEEAASLAAEADTVILTLGEHPQQSGEGGARTDLTLPACQLRLLETVCQSCKNVVVLLFSGRPLAVKEAAERASAVLAVWFPGTEGGNAAADILSGDVNPSGRLAMSFPYCTGQEPLCYSHLPTGRPSVKGSENRFTSAYLDAPVEPLFPFGYGLSYTEFRYRDVRVSSSRIETGGEVTVRGMVKNTGGRAGAETVLCYVQDAAGSTARPVKELKGFQKLDLEPGEEKEFSFVIREEELRFFTAEGKYATEPGLYRIYVGDSVTEMYRAE